MKNWNKICGILSFFLFFSQFSIAQKSVLLINKSVIPSENKPVQPFSINNISSDYYTKNMGFMCKKELQLEKTTKIPLRFRLGSLNYVNYLEGKKN